MLHNENGVEDHGCVPEEQFTWVSLDFAPVVLRSCVDEELPDTENASSEIQENVPDVPADGALAHVIEVDLRKVLHQRHGHLHFCQSIQHAQPCEHTRGLP